MSYGLWLSAAGMQVNEYRQDILANNLANANTHGFKKDLAVFSERLVESRASAAGQLSHPTQDNLSGGTFVAPTYHSFADGPMTQTGKPLDVAIDGEGFFAVEVDGSVKYTRDGRFMINENNELVMATGQGRHRVLDDAGSPIRLPADLPADIAPDGMIRQGKAIVGQIGLVEFEDRNGLRKVGANLFEATAGRPQAASRTNLIPRTVEQSNADPVSGLASLIEVSRAYQLNAQMVSLQDQTIGQAVSRVGRVG